MVRKKEEVGGKLGMSDESEVGEKGGKRKKESDN